MGLPGAPGWALRIRLPHPNLPETSLWALAQPLSWEVMVSLFQKGNCSSREKVTCPNSDSEEAAKQQNQVRVRGQARAPWLLLSTLPATPCHLATGSQGAWQASRVQQGEGNGWQGRCPHAPHSHSYSKPSLFTALLGGNCPQAASLPPKSS